MQRIQEGLLISAGTAGGVEGGPGREYRRTVWPCGKAGHADKRRDQMDEHEVARRAKLPQWARFYIEKLEADIKDLKKSIGDMIPVPEDRSNRVVLEHFPDVECEQPLPIDRAIKFRFGDHAYLSVRLSSIGEIKVYGSDRISIEPSSSNVVSVRVEGSKKP